MIILKVILAYGIKKSTEQATEEHPYGYSNMQYVSSLISGVGIFCMGAGLSIYHGITGLAHAQELESLTLALLVLGGSFLSESVTLAVAVKSTRLQYYFLSLAFFFQHTTAFKYESLSRKSQCLHKVFIAASFCHRHLMIPLNQPFL